jgi:hypothetical protein
MHGPEPKGFDPAKPVPSAPNSGEVPRKSPAKPISESLEGISEGSAGRG